MKIQGIVSLKNVLCRAFICMILLVMFASCASFVEIMDIVVPDEPYAVCDAETVGTQWKGKTCLKMSDGYRWEKE